MHDLKEELANILNNNKREKEILSLEELVNSDYEKEYNKVLESINVNLLTLESMVNKYNKLDGFSMEAHSQKVSLEGFIGDVFEAIYKALITAFKFIYDLVVRVINALFSMFKSKEYPDTVLNINNQTKLLTYVYLNNIKNNTLLNNFDRDLELVRKFLETSVVSQSILFDIFYKLVEAYQTNAVTEPNYSISDIINTVFETKNIKVNISFSKLSKESDNLSIIIDALMGSFSTSYHDLPQSEILSFKVKKETIELESHVYTKRKDVVDINKTIRIMNEDQVTSMVANISDNDVFNTVKLFEKFIADSKRDNKEILNNISGYNSSIEKTASDISRLLKNKKSISISQGTVAGFDFMNSINEVIKLAVNVNKFSITYLKDVLISTMSSYNAVPEIYSPYEKEEK